MKIPSPRLHWLILLIASLLFFWYGGHRAFHDSCDFVPVYTGARCLLHGCNPYDTLQLEEQYLQGGGRTSEHMPWYYEVPLYPPSTFLVLSPLSLLRYPVARLIWFVMNGCLFVTSTVLILSLCPRSHRSLATAFGSIVLVSCTAIVELGQPAAFAISLLVIGYFLFLRGRFLPLAAFLLLLSLAVKPQIGGLIVLYLLVRGIHRHYAAAAIAGAVALLICAGLILRSHPRSADWAASLRANISENVQVGSANDPRPTNKNAVTLVNLQAITSIYLSDEREFNAAAYAVFLALLAVWVVAALRTNAGPEAQFLLIGSLAVLSLLPVYHHVYDGGLLLVSIPAVMIVYQKRHLLGAFIGVLTVLTVNYTQYREQAFLLHHSMWQSVLQNKLLFILLLRQQNLALPILFCLYMAAMFSIRFPSTPADGDSHMLSPGVELH